MRDIAGTAPGDAETFLAASAFTLPPIAPSR